MKTWLAAFYRRARRERAQRFFVLHIRNRVVWGHEVPIEDLTDPTGKRLLFELPDHVGKEACRPEDGPWRG